MITVSKVTQADNTTIAQHLITSNDEVVAIYVVRSSAPVVQINNGTPLVSVGTVSYTDNAAVTESGNLYYVSNPPIGPLTVTSSASSRMTVISLRGVDKKTAIPQVFTATGTGNVSIAANASVANSMLLAFTHFSDHLEGTTTTATPNSNQTQVSLRDGTTVPNYASSYIYANPAEPQTLGWTVTGGVTTDWGAVVIALAPAQAPSAWFPNLNYYHPTSFNGQPFNLTAGTSPTNFSSTPDPTTFWQNSFLHTVGRVLPPPPTTSPAGVLPLNRKIVIDKFTQATSGANPTAFTFQHQASSGDAVLVVGVLAQSSTNPPGVTVSTGGSPIATVDSQTDGGNNTLSVAYTNAPPTGSFPITVTLTNAPTHCEVYAYTLLGVDKKPTLPSTFKRAVASSTSPFNSPFSLSTAYSMVIDFIYEDSADTAMTPNSPQIQTASNAAVAGLQWASSYQYVAPGSQITSWNTGTANAISNLGIILEPAQAPSLWFPDISPYRSSNDLARVNALDVGTATKDVSVGAFAASFWQNSFLHTVGRIMPFSAATTPIPAAETEQQTSQILIDKVYQGQSGSGASLTMDINIPSPDAYLVVTGGSVTALGGAWQSVTLNGNGLTKLVGQSTVGADAEIWALPFPTVGTYPLTVVPTATFGQAYVNAVVLLGVDKRSVSVQTASASDAASTSIINTQITPDAPNSLVLNVLSTLNASFPPAPDENQNQIFNATPINANEYIVAGFQIVSASEVIEYNLGAAVNASLVAVAFRPANAISQWFPSIDTKTLDGPVNVSALDSGKSPVSGQYGYFPSNFYLNSFLHTIGRTAAFTGAAAVNASVAQVAATVTAAGGTQVVAAVQNVSITQVAATVTAADGGGTTVASVQIASVAQVAATVTVADGGFNAVTVWALIPSQFYRDFHVNTDTGQFLTPALYTQKAIPVSAAISQVAASVTATGGTQVITTSNLVAITQVAANVTATGGTQVVTAQISTSVTQVAGTVTATGGTQTIATVNNVAISQVAGTVTASGGTQVITSGLAVNITQLAGSVTATGGTQSFIAQVNTQIAQNAANVLASGGTQSILAIVPPTFTPISVTVGTTSSTENLSDSPNTPILKGEADNKNLSGSPSTLNINTTSTER